VVVCNPPLYRAVPGDGGEISNGAPPYQRSKCGNGVTAQIIRLRCLICGKWFPAQRRSAKTCSPARRQRLSRDLRAATPPLPPGRFDLIYGDPPWHFTTHSEKGQGRSPSQHYRTMDFDSICRLCIEGIAALDARLALWAYGSMLPKAIELMERWGFT
jgi:hypothetical protein